MPEDGADRLTPRQRSDEKACIEVPERTKIMNAEALKKALLNGGFSGIVTWLFYGLVFRMLIDKQPFKEALFCRESIVFLIIFLIVEIVMFYVTQVRKSGKQ